LPLSTIANIQAATPVETMNNGKLGTTIKVSFYKIEYSFFVDGQTFFHTEMISASIWSDFTRKNNKPFKVNYNPSEPDECLLNLYDL
jgi:hypothetical protein